MKKTTEKIIKSPNLSLISKKHVNKWVALSSDYKKLLAVGDQLKDILHKTKQKDKVVMKVLPQLGYAPNSSK